ncbi:MAG: hypothetical protein ACOCNB_00280, partial [Acetivibrio ethanolgignens]
IQLLRLGFIQKPVRAAQKFAKLVFNLIYSPMGCPIVEKTGIKASLETIFLKFRFLRAKAMNLFC